MQSSRKRFKTLVESGRLRQILERAGCDHEVTDLVIQTASGLSASPQCRGYAGDPGASAPRCESYRGHPGRCFIRPHVKK